jgi:hypothetical protein
MAKVGEYNKSAAFIFFHRTWLKILIEEQRKLGECTSFKGPTNKEIIHLFKTQIKTAYK